MNFEEMTKRLEIPILCIYKDERIIARGIHVNNTVAVFEDSDNFFVTYPDTGVFILFKGSQVLSKIEKMDDYIDSTNITTREIIFQSRNAAADFVLGESGRTNCWK